MSTNPLLVVFFHWFNRQTEILFATDWMCGYPLFLPFIPKVRLLFNFTTYICKSNTILYWTFFYLSLLSYLTFRIKYCKLISYIQQGDDSNDRKFILYEKALFYFRYNSLLFSHINYLAPKIYFYFVSVWVYTLFMSAEERSLLQVLTPINNYKLTFHLLILACL